MDSKRKIECAGIKSKKQRSTITLEEKLNIIRMYEDGKIISTIARDINRPISTVNTIVKDKVRIVESMKDAVPLKGTIITKKRQGPISEMEKLLSHWIEDQTQKGIPLSFLIIQEKARSLYKDLQEKAGITDTESAFKASAGWFERFKKRTNLHSGKVTGAAAGADTDAASKYPEVLVEIIEEEEYLPEQMFNVDETALSWKRMPTRTFIGKEEKSMPGLKVAKDRITVRTGGNISGEENTMPSTPDVKKFTTKGLAEAFNLIDMALAKLESMDPNTERFENVRRRIHADMSSYKVIYDDKKRVTTQSTVDVRCCSQQRQDENSDDPNNPHPSTSKGIEVATGQHLSSQSSTSSTNSPTKEPN